MKAYLNGGQVGEFDDYSQLRIGDKKPAFVYEGDELVYPNPISEGLVLWYDFSGMTNDDTSRDIATDLSGNGNHGTLQNFNYTPESGYNKNKLLFDGVDDHITIPELNLDYSNMTYQDDNGIWAYSGDEVTTVEEDGDVGVRGRNYIVPRDIVSNAPIEEVSWTYDGTTRTFHTIIGNSQNRMYMYTPNFNARDMGVITISGYLTVDGRPFNKSDYRVAERGEVSNMGTLINQTIDEESGYFTETYEDVTSNYILLSANRITLPQGTEVSITELQLEKGTVATDWTPALEDIEAKLRSIEPARSINSYMIYNRALTDAELVHNYNMALGRGQ